MQCHTSAFLLVKLLAMGSAARVKTIDDEMAHDYTAASCDKILFKHTFNGIAVEFDFTASYNYFGKKLTQKCPSGNKQQTCTAKCSNPGGENGGWTIESCACEAGGDEEPVAPSQCKSWPSFKHMSGGVVVDFDLSKGYKNDETVTQSCPSTSKPGTCTAVCKTDRPLRGGWSFDSDCQCEALPEEPTCGRYNPYTYTYHKIPVVFDLSAVYKKDEKVTLACPSGKEGTCTAYCSDPDGENGGWTFPDCGCGVDTTGQCTAYSSFKYTYNGVLVDFDLSTEPYVGGQSLTMSCPTGKEGTCTALCTTPGGKNGGWTFPASTCECDETPADECKEANFQHQRNMVYVVFDAAKGQKAGAKITQTCQAGKGEGTCSAVCYPGGHGNGGWAVDHDTCECGRF